MLKHRPDGTLYETYAESKDAHYRYLNERFDDRALELAKLGFKYQGVPGLNIAVFTRTRRGRVHTIAAGTVLNADEIVWADTIEEAQNWWN